MEGSKQWWSHARCRMVKSKGVGHLLMAVASSPTTFCFSSNHTPVADPLTRTPNEAQRTSGSGPSLTAGRVPSRCQGLPKHPSQTVSTVYLSIRERWTDPQHRRESTWELEEAPQQQAKLNR